MHTRKDHFMRDYSIQFFFSIEIATNKLRTFKAVC